VEIENYRSIRALHFEPKPLCALVGPNNAGKSNILAALDLLLGPRYPTDATLTAEDHYRRQTNRRPRVLAQFEYVDEGGFPRPMRFEFGPEAPSGDLKLRCWGDGFAGSYARREVRDRFSLIRLDVERGARLQQPTNRWTLLGRLLLEINADLQRDEARMARFREAMEELRDEVLASVPSFQSLVEVIRSETARQLQRTVEDVSVEFALHDPWNFYRTLQLVVQEAGMTFRADQTGMGLQSSLAIAILRAYAKIARADRVIVAIEEPELFLHPLAQRQFYALMRELAYPSDDTLPLQIIYATHSGEMLDFEHFDEICLVRKEETPDGWTTTCTQAGFAELVEELRHSGVADATEDSVAGRLRATFDRGRTDGIFASVVLLVEGPSEELSIPVYASHLGFDLNANNVAVVAAGGKTNIPLLFRAFAQFGIACYVVFDADSHKDEQDAKGDINDQIIQLVGAGLETFPPTTVTERCAVWAEDFERMLRTEVADYEILEAEAGNVLGGPGKGIRARYAALALTARDEVPAPIRELLYQVGALGEEAASGPAGAGTRAATPSGGRRHPILGSSARSLRQRPPASLPAPTLSSGPEAALCVRTRHDRSRRS
jgi:putative ATP-dependent endonuclease of OLD family